MSPEQWWDRAGLEFEQIHFIETESEKRISLDRFEHKVGTLDFVLSLYVWTKIKYSDDDKSEFLWYYVASSQSNSWTLSNNNVMIVLSNCIDDLFNDNTIGVVDWTNYAYPINSILSLINSKKLDRNFRLLHPDPIINDKGEVISMRTTRVWKTNLKPWNQWEGQEDIVDWNRDGNKTNNNISVATQQLLSQLRDILSHYQSSWQAQTWWADLSALKQSIADLIDRSKKELQDTLTKKEEEIIWLRRRNNFLIWWLVLTWVILWFAWFYLWRSWDWWTLREDVRLLVDRQNIVNEISRRIHGIFIGWLWEKAKSPKEYWDYLISELNKIVAEYSGRSIDLNQYHQYLAHRAIALYYQWDKSAIEMMNQAIKIRNSQGMPDGIKDKANFWLLLPLVWQVTNYDLLLAEFETYFNKQP